MHDPIPLDRLELPSGAALPEFDPPPRFRGTRFETYRPQHPSQVEALDRAARFATAVAESSQARGPRWPWRRRPTGAGLYLDGGFGVGKTHLLAATFHGVPLESRIYLSFQELVYVIGVLGRAEAQRRLCRTRLLCIDEFELDDPGNTLIVKTFLASAFEEGGAVITTSNTSPEAQGQGRFNSEDFQREIQSIARRFEVVAIGGPDYRARERPGSLMTAAELEEALSSDAPTGPRVTSTWPGLLALLASLHPIHYRRLLERVGALYVSGVEPIAQQADALRFVHFIDKLYDARVGLRASGAVPLSELFDPSYRNSAFARKHRRCLSRLAELIWEPAGATAR